MAFNKSQTASFRTLASMFHPDKLGDKGEVVLELATKISAILNNAKDKDDWFTVSDILNLVAKYGITKNNYDNIESLWEEYDSSPKHTQTNFKAKNEPKQKPKPTINEDILNQAKAQRDSKNWDRKKLTAWMGLEFDLFGAYAKVYLDLIFAKKKGEARTGWASQLYTKLALGPISREELAEWISSTGSSNVKNHETHYWAICELANKIWASK